MPDRSDLGEYLARTVPSGGALYPLEFYVAVVAVDGITPGLYHYTPMAHGLELLRYGDFDGIISSFCPGIIKSTNDTDDKVELSRDNSTVQDERLQEQASSDSSSAVWFIATAMFWRSRWKYGLRGYRFALLEAGHAVQNLLLTAEALHLGAVPVAGFHDADIESLLSIDGVNEACLYVVPVGRRTDE